MIRRRLGIVLGIAACVLCAGADAWAASSKRIRPTNDVPAVTIQMGRQRLGYHVARTEKPFEFRIKGPTAIRLLSRVLYDGPPPAEPVRYRLRLVIDGVELQTLGETASPAGNARLEGEPVGALRRRVLHVPAGNHKVLVYPDEKDARVALRVLAGDGRKKKIAWVSYAPDTYGRALRLHGRDSETTYYQFTTDKPVTLSIHGPLRMRVLTRLDFGVAHGYSISYAVKCFLDDGLLRTYSLTSHASHTSTYPDLPTITPGTAESIYLDVPKGLHEVSFVLDGTTAQSASLRVLIPRKAVRNGR